MSSGNGSSARRCLAFQLKQTNPAVPRLLWRSAQHIYRCTGTAPIYGAQWYIDGFTTNSEVLGSVGVVTRIWAGGPVFDSRQRRGDSNRVNFEYGPDALPLENHVDLKPTQPCWRELVACPGNSICLASPSRSLCRHEVWLISTRCATWPLTSGPVSIA